MIKASSNTTVTSMRCALRNCQRLHYVSFSRLAGRRQGFSPSSSVDKKPLPNNLITPPPSLLAPPSSLSSSWFWWFTIIIKITWVLWLRKESNHTTAIIWRFWLFTIIISQKATINNIPQFSFSHLDILECQRIGGGLYKYLDWNMGIAFLWYLYGEGISVRVWEYFSGILSRAIARNKPSLAVVNHLLLPNTKTFLIFIIFTKPWKISVSKYKDDYVCYSHLLHFGVWGIIKRFRNSSAWKPQLVPSSATSIKSFISCSDYSSIPH